MHRPVFALLLLLACTLLPLASAQQPSWSLCPDSPTDFAVNDCTLSLQNRTIAMAINATVDQDVLQGAVVALTVLLNGSPLYTQDLDWTVGGSLPVQAGVPFIWKYAQEIPSIAPAGAYEVDLMPEDQNGDPLACIAVKFQLSAEQPIKEKQLIAEY